jgi:hypothetical protein
MDRVIMPREDDKAAMPECRNEEDYEVRYFPPEHVADKHNDHATAETMSHKTFSLRGLKKAFIKRQVSWCFHEDWRFPFCKTNFEQFVSKAKEHGAQFPGSATVLLENAAGQKHFRFCLHSEHSCT